jgi:hypothetical protein
VKFKLQAGREVAVLTQDELSHHLDQQTVSWFQEMARGLSTARFDTFAMAAEDGSVTLPAPGASPIGPEVGYCWAIQRITGDFAGDALTVYRNSVQPPNKLGVLTPTSSLHFGSKGAILRGDERLLFTGAGLETGQVTISGEAIEVGESDLYKLI